MSKIEAEIEAKVEKLVNLVFDGEFEAFTPWWGGNEFGYTFSPEPHYPEPKEIIGKTKWTIRTLCGNVPKELGGIENSDEEVKIASQVKVSVNVIEPGKKYFEKVPEIRGRKALENMREEGYALLFQGYKHNMPSAIKEYEGFYKLLTIPRFYLRIMKKSADEIYKLQPMKPGFKIRIRVFSRDKDVAKLFVNAMIITLKYLGIGSAANRGFGRFKLVKVNQSIEGIENVDITKGISIECKENASSFPRFPQPGEIKVIKQVKAYIGGRKYVAKNIEGVLAAIGISTLKSTWKSYCRNPMGSGADYHTWVLGLPREVKGKGYVGNIKRKGGKEGELRRQSYIVISPTEDLGVMLLPFYADDYITIYHVDHAKREVTKIERRRPGRPYCTPESPSQSVKDHIDVALEWLETILG